MADLLGEMELGSAARLPDQTAVPDGVVVIAKPHWLVIVALRAVPA